MLWKKVFNTTELKSDQHQTGLPLINEDWKDIGFQGNNPRTDFRGGGHLSLLCLLYMVDNYQEEWETLCRYTKEKEHLMWLTAIASINVTHGLVIYFYMNSDNVSPHQTKLRAGRTQFKKFCKLNYMSKRAFFELNAFCLRALFREWNALVAKEGEGNIPKIMGSF